MIDRAIADDREQPGAWSGAVGAKLGRAAPEGDEGILHDLLCGFGVAEHAAGHRERNAAVPLVERRERRPVAAGHVLYECDVALTRALDLLLHDPILALSSARVSRVVIGEGLVQAYRTDSYGRPHGEPASAHEARAQVADGGRLSLRRAFYLSKVPIRRTASVPATVGSEAAAGPSTAKTDRLLPAGPGSRFSKSFGSSWFGISVKSLYEAA